LLLLPGHRGYGSSEADMLSKEVIQDRLQALIPEEERQSNGHSKDHDATEDAGGGSEPDSPSSPGWDQAPGSPTLDLSSFQGVVEEGMLVNVAGSPGDMLEELGCLELDDADDEEVNDITEGHTSIHTTTMYEQNSKKRNPAMNDDNVRAEQQEEKSCNEEELIRHKERFSGEVSEDEHSRLSSPEIHSHEDQVLDDNEDPDQKSVSDAELADLMKTINSSD